MVEKKYRNEWIGGNLTLFLFGSSARTTNYPLLGEYNIFAMKDMWADCKTYTHYFLYTYSLCGISSS